MDVPELAGKVIAMPVGRTDAGTLVGFAEHAVEAGTIVCTNNVTAYSRLPYRSENQTGVHSVRGYVCSPVHRKGIRCAWLLLKQAVQETSHDVSPKHLDQYLNEEAFRLNEGKCHEYLLDHIAIWAQQIGKNRISCEALIARNGLYAREI